jgi:4a-hydroxytetrahydrobiopterin dehydratase
MQHHNDAQRREWYGWIWFPLAIATTSLAFMLSPEHPGWAAELLPDSTIPERLATLDGGWEVREQTLHCTYEFGNFVEAVTFVNRLVEPAERLGHHPDLLIRYNRVTVVLTTHDAGGLTALDFQLAAAITALSDPSSARPRSCR